MLFFGSDIPVIISFVITALFAFAYHELAHALVADRLGDPTPRSYGRISLNPFVHLDLFGTIMLLLVGFGWASTPVSPDRLRGNPRTSMAVVAVAGPVANLIMAILLGLPVLFGLVTPEQNGEIMPSAFGFLIIGVQINVLLMVFNLMPIPPLDGFTILLGLLPSELAFQLLPLRQYGTLILIVVIFLLPRVGFSVFDLIISPTLNTLVPILLGL
jgi:Zn-dependent protease